MEKMRFISPECHRHDHVDCPLNVNILKCECICHKCVGE